MRHILLASALCSSLVLAAAMFTPAEAVLPVTDAASIAQRALEAARNIQQLVMQYSLMRQQYAEMIDTFNALSHPNEALSVATGLLQQQIQSPGSAPALMPGLAFGTQLTGAGVRFYSQNHVYTPDGTDFEATEIQRRQMALANLQGEAQTGFERSNDRLSYLGQLQSNIGAQPDITAVSAAEAHISSEQLYLANESNNVARMQLMQQMQAQVDTQRVEQSDRKAAEDWHTAVAAEAFGE